MIEIINEKNVVSMLDSKRQRNAYIFAMIARELGGGWTDGQCRNKWKARK